MDIKQPSSEDIEKIVNTEAFSRIEEFIIEITEKDKIYRTLSGKEMDVLLIEKTNKLVQIFIEFNDLINTWDNESFYLAIQNYTDGLNNPTMQICLRYNISNIITYCKSYELPDEPFKSFFDDKLTIFRRLVHYIEQHKIDIINQKIINIQSKTLTDIIENSNILEEKLTSITGDINAFKKHSTKMVKELSKARKSLGSIMEQALGIIGIFSGIILVFFSGLSLIDSFKSIDNISIYRLAFITILTGAIIINIIFFLMFFISRISGKSINVICAKFSEKNNNSNPNEETTDDEYIKKLQKTTARLESINEERLCANCINSNCGDNKCSFLEKVINKYPYVLFANMGIFFIELIIIFAWLFKNYILIDYSIITKNAIITMILASASVIAIFVFFITIMYSIGKSRIWNMNRIYYIILGSMLIIILIASLFLWGISIEKNDISPNNGDIDEEEIIDMPLPKYNFYFN